MLPPFLLGVMLAFARYRQPNHLLLVLWLLATIAGNAMVFAIITPRYPIIMPALAIFTAVGLVMGLPLVLSTRLTRLVALAAVIFYAIWNVNWYFLDVVPRNVDYHQAQLAQNDTYDMTDVLVRVAELPPRAAVHVFADDHLGLLQVTLPYFNSEIDFYLFSPDDDELDAHLDHFPAFVSNLVFLRETDSETKAHIERYYVLSDPMYTPNNLPRSRSLVMYHIVDRRRPQ